MSVLPLCDAGLDGVLGFARSIKLLDQILAEQFKGTRLPVASVVDEFGGVEGLVSLTDVIGSIVGALPLEPGEEPAIVRREDRSGCSTVHSACRPYYARSTRSHY
jgi:CBS domain containing-hemolysin-like protein